MLDRHVLQRKAGRVPTALHEMVNGLEMAALASVRGEIARCGVALASNCDRVRLGAEQVEIGLQR
jgi:hypothetical protein